MLPIQSSISAYAKVDPLGRRNTPDNLKHAFQEILTKRESAPNTSDKQFLRSLNSEEMDTIKAYNHQSSRSINIDNLSDEGAHNLIAAPGDLKDLNNDGLVTVGEANMEVFPPPGQPDGVYVAWLALSPEAQKNIRHEADLKWTLANMGMWDKDLGINKNYNKNYQTIFNQPGVSFSGFVDQLMTQRIQQNNIAASDNFQNIMDDLTHFKNELIKHKL
ncbi:MAG: hypothetical protein JWM44_2326 [Bacilli bacterium]|nr:hypothetical protein [Bacilli bacterium]